MKILVYQCDECGVQKQESNHWVVGYMSARGGVRFVSWPQRKAPSGRNVIHLCGAGCAGKVLDRQIAKWKEK